MIREGRSEDAEVIAELIRSSNAEVADRLGLSPETAPTHPSNCQADWVRRDLARGLTYFLLECDGVAEGCVALEIASESLGYLERLPEDHNMPVMLDYEGFPYDNTPYYFRNTNNLLREATAHDLGDVGYARIRLAAFHGYPGVERGENQVTIVELGGLRPAYGLRGHLRREGPGKTPPRRIAVPSARRTIRCRHGRDLEPGVTGQQLHKPLPHHARGSQNANFDLFHAPSSLDQQVQTCGSRALRAGRPPTWTGLLRLRRQSPGA